MDVSAFNIGRHLTDLVGRNVTVKAATKVDVSPHTRTACYTVEPNQGTAVVQLDFHLMAMLGGTMIGFPQAEIDGQIQAGKLGDDLIDATNEVMNVLSSVIVSEGRAIFKGIYLRAAEYSSRAQQVMGGGFPLHFQVTPNGGKPGFMTIVSDVV